MNSSRMNSASTSTTRNTGGGSSKANHLRTFIEAEDGFLVGRGLRRLWQVREEEYVRVDSARTLPEAVQARFFDLVGRVEAGFSPPFLVSLSGVAEILKLDTVSRDPERALASAQHDPEDAVTAAVPRSKAYAGRSAWVRTARTSTL